MRTDSLVINKGIMILAVMLLVFSACPVFAETVTFTYDSLNRLTSATYGNSSIEYTYDSAGNLTQVSTPYTLKVIKTGAGTGTVTSDLPGINCGSDCVGVYSLNDSVILTASVSSGTFTGWSGEGCSGTGTCIVTVDSAKTVTATFECLDADSDTYTTCNGDCDDSDPALNPDTYWYTDNDGDGYGNLSIWVQQCTQPNGPPAYVLDNTDYDDIDSAIGPPTKIDGTTPVYYLTLQEAYNAAADGDIIQCVDVTFIENLTITIDKSVAIEGGYDGAYSPTSGSATLQGDIDISNGTLTLENFILE